MRIVLFSTCPEGTYSGGRYHALIAAYCLARRGHDVAFVTDNLPVFDADLAVLSPDNPVRIVLSERFDAAVAGPVDAVFIAPQISRKRVLYAAALELARRDGAALAMFSYETPNWFNASAPVARPETMWAEWHLAVAQGALVLCSAEESLRHARDFYTDCPPETRLAVWQPAINSVACELAAGEPARRRIVMFVRPGDKHKGSDLVHRLLQPDWAGYLVTVVVGKPTGAEAYVAEITAAAARAGASLEVLYGLSDVEKFALLKSAAALLFPSHFEGYGYPPVEALACGTPCVAYDLPVLRETCGDRLAYAPLGDAEAFLERLADVLRAPPAIDPGDPAIRFLADVDIRAKALEATLQDYIAYLAACGGPPPAAAATAPAGSLDGAQDADGAQETDGAQDGGDDGTDTPRLLEIGLGVPQMVSVDAPQGATRVACLAVASPARIAALTAGDSPAAVVPAAWRGGAWRHLAVLLLPATPDTDAGSGVAPDTSALALTFADGTRVLAAAPDGAAPPVAAAPAGAFGVESVTVAGDEVWVSGWAMLPVAYDSALWVARGREGAVALPGTVGLPNPRQTVTRSAGLAAGVRFRLPRALFEAAEAPVVLLFDGAEPVLARALDPAALAASAVPAAAPVVFADLPPAPPAARPTRRDDSDVLPARLVAYVPPEPAPVPTAVGEAVPAHDAIAAADRPLPLHLQPRAALSACRYDLGTGELRVSGWILTREPAVFSVRSRETGLFIASTGARVKRPDVAKTNKIKGFEDFGFECVGRVAEFDPAAHVVRITLPGGWFEREIDPRLYKASGKPTLPPRPEIDPALMRRGDLDRALPVELRISQASWLAEEQALAVNGWCVTPDRMFELRLSSPQLDLYETIDPPSELREDVFERFPQYRMPHSGWRVRVPLARFEGEATVKVAYSSSRNARQFVAPVRRVDPRIVVESCTYDPAKRTLSVRGWVGSREPSVVTLAERATGVIVASSAARRPRPDIARQLATPGFESYGFEVSGPLRAFDPEGYRLQVAFAAARFEVAVPPARLLAAQEFKVLAQRFDPVWNLIWLRGSFVHPGMRLERVELLQGDAVLAEGVVNIKQLRLGEPNAGWRFESVLPPDYDPALPLEVRGWINGALCVTAPVTLEADEPALTEEQRILGAIARWGTREAADRLLGWRDPAGRPTVLLMIHNLDAVDRPEKVKAIKGLEAALDARGHRLVVFHHSRNRAPGDFVEIGFFDPVLDQLARRDAAGLAADPALPALREAWTRKVYGFGGAVNRTPRDWVACANQIEEEVRKTAFVLRHLAPSAVILWHQWVSLMEVGRHFAGAFGIPSAFLHEGMLPGTMTFDPAGMMAEAGCVGAMLDPADPEAALWLDRADAVIRDIRENRRDRKPLSGLSATAAIRAAAAARGAPLVFYAGVNDWHSGNLPREGAALLHSPHVADTDDGLAAVLAEAEARNWIVLYKPHPNLYPRAAAWGPRLVTVSESNTIDCLIDSDVTVTILSSLSYIACANGRPVVQLGRNTLSGTGAVHEIAGREGIGAAIDAALAGTDAAARQDRFRHHVAELLRRHLYVYDPAHSPAFLDHAALAAEVVRLAAPGGTG